MPQRGEFRATTDTMLEMLDRLRASELRKQAVEIGSPDFLEAAKESEDLSRLAFRWAQMQLQMALAAQNRVEQGQIPSDIRLKNVEPRPLDRVLAHWREAQLRLEISTPGSPEAEAAARDIERLREEYQAGYDARRDGTNESLLEPPRPS
jgi:hypothetical protein